MATIETAMTPREILNRLYLRLRSAFGKFLSAKPGDVEADKAIHEEIAVMEDLIQKLDFAYIKKLLNDANVDPESHEHLTKLQELFLEIEKNKRLSTTKEHLLYMKAKSLKKQMGSRVKKAKRKKTKELKGKQKEKKKEEKAVGVKQQEIKKLSGQIGAGKQIISGLGQEISAEKSNKPSLQAKRAELKRNKLKKKAA